MSVATGIPPDVVADLDPDWFEALVEAVDDHWDVERELLAELVEVSSLHLIAYLQAHSKRRVTAEPIRVPRPDSVRGGTGPERSTPPAPRVSVRELVELTGVTVKAASDGR